MFNIKRSFVLEDHPILVLVFFLLLIGFGVYYNVTKLVVSEQSQAELAEQNRQADVASQLRASERGDLLEVSGTWLARGQYALVLTNKEGRIHLASCLSHEGFLSIDYLSKKVKKVIKYSQGSMDYADAANTYLRCE